ncbi:MAG TPA: tetratricopeptide repeat protein [Puia sp.]|uniref:TPR end-of-group domain-containing protein n=1 Tax=Puia sp. TaxID=2045100 RepID=UPI002C560CC4|nr:tetratricopeptide repeat protein [Puia sp.]HVU95523.1 tetratricopeptide repeat protein [Puia sp.]
MEKILVSLRYIVKFIVHIQNARVMNFTKGWKFAGRIRFKLLNTRIVIASLVLIGSIGFLWFRASRAKRPGKTDGSTGNPSIAVLPFTNVNNNPEGVYFSDGLAEDIRNDLARIKGLKVCARASSFHFRGKLTDVRQVGVQLKANTLLEGSLQTVDDRIKVDLQLIDARTGDPVWTGEYSENMENVGELQGRITRVIAQKLSIEPPVTSPPVPAAKSTHSKEAYACYLKGRAHWNLRTFSELQKAIGLFRQAIALDSVYAAAWSGVADCYTALGYGSFMAPREAFPKALEAATKALQMDSTLAEPHASLGYYKFYYEWDWAAAEQEFRASIAKNANYELGYDWYGYYLTAMRRYDEARIILQRAEELDPLSVAISTDMGFSFYYGGNYDQAITALKASLQKNPRFGLAHLWLGRSYQAKKQYPAAITEYKATLETTAGWPVALAAIGDVYGESGQPELARRVLDTLGYLSSGRFVTAYGVALVYAGLGEKEQAFAWLNKAFDERSNWLVWLKSDPRWAPISRDARFAEMVNRVGLPK